MSNGSSRCESRQSRVEGGRGREGGLKADGRAKPLFQNLWNGFSTRPPTESGLETASQPQAAGAGHQDNGECARTIDSS